VCGRGGFVEAPRGGDDDHGDDMVDYGQATFGASLPRWVNESARARF
jgi:hypothetical protein